MNAVRSLLTFSPYNKLGKIYRIPHYNDHKVSMTRLLRRHWLLDTPSSERDKVVRFIVGECSLIDNITEGLRENYTIEVVTGPKIKNTTIREQLAHLLEEYGSEKLQIFADSVRPERHSALINGNILYEDIHAPKKDYCEGTVIENADKPNINLLINHFNSLKAKGDFKDTPEKIRAMGTVE